MSKKLPPDPTDILEFHDNSTIANKRGVYETVTVDLEKVIESWKSSLFSYEWFTKDGFKEIDELSGKDQERRAEFERKIEKSEPVEKPILGLGVLDNVEIGSGRAVVLTAYILGARTLPVHIPYSQKNFFKDFEV